jgi:hypothetical protein
MTKKCKIPNMPKSVKVSAFTIKIIKWNHKEALGQERMGEFCSNELVIRVDTNYKAASVLDTLLHEISHAIFWAYHINDKHKEESIVSVYSTAWVQVLIDNPAFLIWMVKVLNIIKQEK